MVEEKHSSIWHDIFRKKTRPGFTICLIVLAVCFVIIKSSHRHHGPVHAYKAVCYANLKQIGLRLHIYANDNDSFFPPTVEDFANLCRNPDYELSPGSVYCPADKDNKKPTAITKTELNTPNSVQISYLYYPGSRKTDPANTIILRDNTVDNHGGKGGNVLYVDGSVKWIPTGSYPFVLKSEEKNE